MTNLATPRFLLNGDTAVSAVFGDRISEEVNQTIRAFQLLLTERKVPGIVETVPTYCSLMIHYDPDRISCDRLLGTLRLPSIRRPYPRAKSWKSPSSTAGRWARI